MSKKKGFLKQGEFEQDFELNIASIIDCFVVLIAFILVSTSFFSIGIIDAEIAAANSEAQTASEVNHVVIELKADHSIVLKTGMFGQKTLRITTENLAASLEKLVAKDPELKSAIVQADNSVSYRDVMASMEVAKGKIAQVNLGGF